MNIQSRNQIKYVSAEFQVYAQYYFSEMLPKGFLLDDEVGYWRGVKTYLKISLMAMFPKLNTSTLA
jgi:hypothetical protein